MLRIAWWSWKDRRAKGPTGDRSFQFKVRKPVARIGVAPTRGYRGFANPNFEVSTQDLWTVSDHDMYPVFREHLAGQWNFYEAVLWNRWHRRKTIQRGAILGNWDALAKPCTKEPAPFPELWQATPHLSHGMVPLCSLKSVPMLVPYTVYAIPWYLKHELDSAKQSESKCSCASLDVWEVKTMQLAAW